MKLPNGMEISSSMRDCYFIRSLGKRKITMSGHNFRIYDNDGTYIFWYKLLSTEC